MSSRIINDAPSAPPAEDGAAGAAAPPAGLLDRLRNARRVVRQTLGIPDYDRYLAHAAARHPGAPVLSRRAFCAQAIDRKYGKGGPRCC